MKTKHTVKTNNTIFITKLVQFILINEILDQKIDALNGNYFVPLCQGENDEKLLDEKNKK